MIMLWWGGFFIFLGVCLLMLVMSGIMEYSFIVDLSFLYLGLIDLGFVVLVDWVSLVFFSTLLLMCGSVYMFGSHYMVGDMFLFRFCWILKLFMTSMVLLIFVPNLFWLLVGWDGLGVSSVLLVLFYSCSSSWSSGVKTYLVNRLGDGFMVMGLLYYFCKNKTFFTYSHLSFMGMLLMLGFITKSAQFPFSSWLPVAMAAPTPVSALVHSSTLVTAGVYLIMRLSFGLSYELMCALSFVGMFTMLSSSLAACYEWDSKKIMAYSTLSQLGLMCYCMGFGLFDFSFFHLIMHAVFKALLFICAGYLLLKVKHLQDMRYLWSGKDFFALLFVTVKFSLSGFIFFSGFYSKDLIYEGVVNLNLMLWGGFYFSILLTSFYSFRLYYWVFFKTSNKLVLVDNSFEYKLLSVYLLGFVSVFMGKWVSVKLPSSLMYSFMPLGFKLMVLFLVVWGGVLGLLVNYNKGLSLLLSNLLYTENFNSSFMMKKLSFVGKSLFEGVDCGLLMSLNVFASSYNVEKSKKTKLMVNFMGVSRKGKIFYISFLLLSFLTMVLF